MKRLFQLAAFVGLLLPAAASAAGDVIALPSIAAVQALGAAAGTYPEIQTTSYYAGVGKGGARYTWNASSTANDCAHVAATGVATGRFVLRADLQNNNILPTQCGAYFDNSHDDYTFWNLTEVAANANGYVIGCVPGSSKIGTPITPGVGVVHRGCGMGMETINSVNTIAPAIYLQNANGTNNVQAPQFYDMTISCPSSGAAFSCVQFNSIAGGFTDDGSSQAYMFYPVMKNVEISGGGIVGAVGGAALQCSKCFEVTFDNNFIHAGQGYGVDIEGSDFVSVSHNRVLGTGDIPIKFKTRGTFGNFDIADHNDVLVPSSGVDSYIWSDAREGKIIFNGMEGATSGSFQIHQAGGLQATIADNTLSDVTVNAAIGIEGNTFYRLDVHGNSTEDPTKVSQVNGGNGLAVYISGGVRQNMIHYGNGNEAGFPFNLESTTAIPIGNVLMDITPNSYLTVSPNNYGSSVNVKSGALATGQSPAWVIPALSGTGSLVTFPNEVPTNLAGTLSVCFKAIAGSTSQTFKVQLLDNGVAVGSPTSVTMNQGQPLYCPAGVQHVAIATNLGVQFRNDDTGTGATVYLYEIIVNNG